MLAAASDSFWIFISFFTIIKWLGYCQIKISNLIENMIKPKILKK